MIVQSFSQAHRWFEDFAAFCAFLGLDARRGEPMIRPLPNGGNLILGWATGDPRHLAEMSDAQIERTESADRHARRSVM